MGSLSEFSEYGRAKENPGQYPDDLTMISNLLADHEQVIRNMRTDIDKCDDEYHDMGTNDFPNWKDQFRQYHNLMALLS